MSMEIIQSLGIYVGTLLLTLALSYIYEHALIKGRSKILHSILITLICLPLSLLAGFRGVGTDFYNYLNIFDRIASGSLQEAFARLSIEPLFIIIVKLLSVIHNSSSFIFFGLEFITLYVVCCAYLRINGRKGLTLFLFFYYLILYHYSFNIVRQVLAMSIGFLAISYLLERKIWRSIAVTVLAGLVHVSSLIILLFVPLYLYNSKRDSRLATISRKAKYRDRITLMAIFSSVFILPVLMNLATNISIFKDYSRFIRNISSVQLGFGVLFYACITIGPMFILGKDACYSNKKLQTIRMFSMIYLPLAYAGYYADHASRLSLFAKIFPALYVVLYCSIERAPSKTRKLRWLYIALYVFLYYHFFINLNYGDTFPYYFAF